MQVLRYWDYYSMTETFTDLHERARNKQHFHNLYDTIVSKENILLAYRSIKSNKGSHTAGTDGKTITDLERLSEEAVVQLVRKLLVNYRPKQVKRVLIPKPNGKKRPLGIPCMMDRVIQQCFKQVLEPIAEAWFYKHSYGFRPLRSTHFALARVQHLINTSGLHYIVDIDIKGFFDNVNHTLLIKQLWNMGIRDRVVLRIISKMLKAKIKGEGIPSKGTPQGGILSPLLSNIVLNDLDQWIVGQWEGFETRYSYSNSGKKIRALKTTNLKEGYIVRYADDFKILCRDWKSAQKWFHAVSLYLKNRLKLEISSDKSQIVNLRKRKSEFLGFTIWTTKKRKSRVAHTGISEKKKQQLKQGLKERINNIRLSSTTKNALLYNSFVMGIHNYFKRATHVNKEFALIAYELKRFIYNRLKRVGKYTYPSRPPPTYSKFYSLNYRTFLICGVYLYPLADVQMSFNTYLFKPELSLFTKDGRERIHKELRPDIQFEITKLMKSSIPNRSIEYKDNRISRYSMKLGKCEISGIYLLAEDVHCHHYRPTYLGGTDKFDNLRILHKEMHRLIHASDKDTICLLMNKIGVTDSMVQQINQYRKISNMELIDLTN